MFEKFFKIKKNISKIEKEELREELSTDALAEPIVETVESESVNNTEEAIKLLKKADYLQFNTYLQCWEMKLNKDFTLRKE